MHEDSLVSGTWVTFRDGEPTMLRVRRCRLDVESGPDVGTSFSLAGDTIRLGARAGLDVVLTDSKVSALHLEITLDETGYRIRDLASTNGTFVQGIQVSDAYLVPNAVVKVGRTELRFRALADSTELALSSESRFHDLIGRSVPMRRLFSLLTSYAGSDANVLISGETGVGKELAAEAVHRSSPRSDGPFVVVDCGAIPANLIENELFGHEAGAFTGATETVAGVFERAHGGTLFFDEIGELPLDMQPRLLRAVQSRKVRRIGGSKTIECNVRIIAATNRDLAVEVNRGNFRADLYYRLAVARVKLPPLRERREDIPLLIEAFRTDLARDTSSELPDQFLAKADKHYWPGNVRELRNAVERALLLPKHPVELEIVSASSAESDASWPPLEISVPFKVAKKQFVDEFDRRYMRALLDDNGWNISAAARAAGVDRMSVYKLLQRLGLERD